METIFNAKQAGDLVGVSKTTMADWCERGFVPGAQKVGRIWAIPESSLDKIDRPPMGRPPKESNGNGNGNAADTEN